MYDLAEVQNSTGVHQLKGRLASYMCISGTPQRCHVHLMPYMCCGRFTRTPLAGGRACGRADARLREHGCLQCLATLYRGY